ncbi:MAG TPA: hypothetical protein ENH07_05820 [Nitrospirae bacterium]|nr:hypothetical protein [Nitrospirota bacterium]HDY72293.1 hypothetical protein [Nitrospirota bacterium]
MTEERDRALKVGRKIGALVGAIVFVVFGIVPGFYFGSYAAVVLLSSLAGGPLEAGIIVRMLVVVGIVLGLFCTAAASIVIGSVIGTTLAYIADAVSSVLKPVSTGEEAKSTVSHK